MKPQHEIEIKLKVSNPRTLKRRLAELEFYPLRRRYFESNHLFDFPNQRLRKARCLLRLRFAANNCVLTFKGSPLRSRDYKVRTEYETKVEDGKLLWHILEGVGLVESFRYEKYRTVYARKPDGSEAGDWNGVRTMYVLDPDGVTIELVERPRTERVIELPEAEERLGAQPLE